MQNINPLQDYKFLVSLFSEKVKTHYVKILVLGKQSDLIFYNTTYNEAINQKDLQEMKKSLDILDNNNEIPIKEIQGKITGGSLSVSDSSVRKAGSVTFVAENKDNDLADIDNLLAINKKIKILVGLENNIDKNYEKIIWFNKGVFVITQPSLSHSLTDTTVSLQFKDKMCLLDGSCGGGLPAAVIFDKYDQIITEVEIQDFPSNPNDYSIYKKGNQYFEWNSIQGWHEGNPNLVGQTVERKQRVFDIIQSLVANYGGEALSKIVIDDVPLEIKNSVRYIGSDFLCRNINNNTFRIVSNEEDISASEIAYTYNDDCGYIYTDLTYPGELVSSIGDSVCSILDKIKDAIGNNYEYFYDEEGYFIFREKKNYLNTVFLPIQKLDEKGCLLNEEECFVDFTNVLKTSYIFEENNGLISSYSNSPSYDDVKNDFHIWGKSKDGYAIHYHLAIKEKPNIISTWKVVNERDEYGEYTGRIKLYDMVLKEKTGKVENKTLSIPTSSAAIVEDNVAILSSFDATVEDNVVKYDLENEVYNYTPADWRAELYLRGMQKQVLEQRPDVYEQELLDLFDSIYDMRKKNFKSEIKDGVNLHYWFDYINPDGLSDISIDVVGPRVISMQNDDIIKMYTNDVPDIIFINKKSTKDSQVDLIKKCEAKGQAYSRVSGDIYDALGIGTMGYSAQDYARDLMYQNTSRNESISISCVPIYYLDVNTLITVNDKLSSISGDYIIESINLPLGSGENMSISASKSRDRV